MQPDWAAENLQTIRTLMERSAVYRRALAPLLGLIGATGIVAAAIGAFTPLNSPRAFIGYWMTVSLIGLAEAFLLIRRQALADAEPFWSSPMRRVVQALLPPFTAGLVAGIVLAALDTDSPLPVVLIVPLWMVLYGCALHAAGFFMPRGFKLFGWGFTLFGCAVAAAVLCKPASIHDANLIMGAGFGGGHLAYSIYLYFTEKNKAAA